MPGECASHLLYMLSNPIVTQVLSSSSSYPTCAHLLLLTPPTYVYPGELCGLRARHRRNGRLVRLYVRSVIA